MMTSFRFRPLGVGLSVIVGAMLLRSTGLAQVLPAGNSDAMRQEYFAMKRVFTSENQSLLASSGKIPKSTVPIGIGDIYLGTCNDGGEFGESSSAPYDDELSRLAFAIVSWRVDLSMSGYPVQSWRPLLVDFEDKSLAELREHPTANLENTRKSFQGFLSAQLARYRQASGQRLPTVYADDSGCGAGEINIKINTDPPQGQIKMISQFLYKVCKAEGLNPNDAHTCTRWWDVPDNAAVSGYYQYQVRWRDGGTACGLLSAEKIPDDKFTISKVGSDPCPSQ